MSKNNIKATVFIPTYNGEDYLKDILTAIFNQKFDHEYEVLIIDSGSTDATLGIIDIFARKNRNLRLHRIPNNEFGHGKTRNLAAYMAKGEYVIFLSHDAVPSHKLWLYEMLKPFELSPRVAGVIGRQIPRLHCPPILKYEINHVFAQLGPTHATSFYYKDIFVNNEALLNALSYYSDVNSAAPRRILLNEVPYRDVQYAEDQLFGRDIIEKGYIKAYSARGSVVHSNDVRLRHYSKRIFDETLALRNIGLFVNRPSRMRGLIILLRGILGDTKRIVFDPAYTIRRKLQWIIINPLFHLEKWRGINRAFTVKLDDISMHSKYSLESHMKK